jgi:hypothetical protein
VQFGLKEEEEDSEEDGMRGRICMTVYQGFDRGEMPSKVDGGEKTMKLKTKL